MTQEEKTKKSTKNWSSTSHNQRQRGGFGARGRGRYGPRNHNGGRGQHQQQNRAEGADKSYTRDRSTVKCFNCNVYGHYAAECRKPRREREKNKEQTHESNLTKIEDDESTLLLTELDRSSEDIVLLNEEKVVPSFNQKGGVKVDKNMWYLDNGASNHMTGHREKFNELNESVTGQVHFEDGSTVKIKG